VTTTDVLYLCRGRVEFTRASLTNLLAVTDWDRVNSFYVYHDAPPGGDGETTEWLKETVGDLGRVRVTNLRSPVAVMGHFLNRTRADLFAKIDSDVIVPPGWLGTMQDCFRANNRKIDLLGMEADQAKPPPHDWDGVYRAVRASHIGGVGLMRVDSFKKRGNPKPDGYFGFTEWQHNTSVRPAWIQPDLQCFLLDRVPFEPWKTITARYINEGINRDWGKYDDDMNWYWDWWSR
jgi:hypothetical protein